MRLAASSGAWPSRVALLVVLVAIGAACAKVASRDEELPPGPLPQPSPTPACSCEPSAAVVDPTLLAFLSKARAIHHEADLAEDAGDRARAIALLEQLVNGPHPGGAAPAPEITEVIADTRARLADLRSAVGQFDAAGRDVDEGLRLAASPTHFRGHLFEVRGLVEARREKALKASGDLSGAHRAHEAAISAFDQAVTIQDEVIGRALADAGSPDAR